MPLIKPTVFVNTVLQEMQSSLRIGWVATDFTKLVPELKNHGDTVSWPSVRRVAKAANVARGEKLHFRELLMDENKSTVNQIAAPMTIYDSELVQLPIKKQMFVRDTTDAVVEKIEYDLVEAMKADAVYYSPQASATAITDTEITNALAPFGDKLDNFAGIIVNSRLVPSFMSMTTSFIDGSKTNAVKGNGIFRNGYLGLYLGIIPVIVCDTGTWDDVAKETITYLVKKDALGWALQRKIDVKEDYDIDYLRTKLAAVTFVTTKLIDNSGCCIIRKTLPSALIETKVFSIPGSSSGKTIVFTDVKVPSGMTAKYQTGETVTLPEYDSVLTTGWTEFTHGAEYTATNDHAFVVAYVNTADNKAKYVGETKVVSA